MKRFETILWATMLAAMAGAQQSNQTMRSQSGGHGPGRGLRDRPAMDQARIQEFQQRKYLFMEHMLKEIGVSDEDKAKIMALQDQYREQMGASVERSRAARQKLDDLQDKGASQQEIDAAIAEVAAAQADQLRILVRNRSEMEKILGKEKCDKLMDRARTQFHERMEHRGGPGLPPMPIIPPMPGGQRQNEAPPPTPAK